MEISEKLRQELLKEEFRLRAKQPAAWTKIKYRKNVKLPKDLLRKARKKFGKDFKHSKIKLKRRKFKKKPVGKKSGR